MKKQKIKTIFNGKEMCVWTDDTFVTIAIGLTSVAIDFDDWNGLKEDFKALLEKERVSKVKGLVSRKTRLVQTIAAAKKVKKVVKKKVDKKLTRREKTIASKKVVLAKGKKLMKTSKAKKK